MLLHNFSFLRLSKFLKLLVVIKKRRTHFDLVISPVLLVIFLLFGIRVIFVRRCVKFFVIVHQRVPFQLRLSFNLTFLGSNNAPKNCLKTDENIPEVCRFLYPENRNETVHDHNLFLSCPWSSSLRIFCSSKKYFSY